MKKPNSLRYSSRFFSYFPSSLVFGILIWIISSSTHWQYTVQSQCTVMLSGKLDFQPKTGTLIFSALGRGVGEWK